MSSFRSQLIGWIEARKIKARPFGAVIRHQALIEDGLHLIIQHDSLSPQSDALAWIRLKPLPYDQTQREVALHIMLALNQKMLSSENFGLTLSDDGEYISLLCRAAAAEMAEIEFHRMMAQFFGWAKRARDQLAGTGQKAPIPPDLNARYL